MEEWRIDCTNLGVCEEVCQEETLNRRTKDDSGSRVDD